MILPDFRVAVTDHRAIAQFVTSTTDCAEFNGKNLPPVRLFSEEALFPYLLLVRQPFLATRQMDDATIGKAVLSQ